MERHPRLRPERFGIVGTSKGAEAALLIATRDRRVGGVVAFAPSSVAWSCICPRPEEPSWTRRGEAVPFVGPGADPTYAPPPGFPLEPAVHFLHRLRQAGARGEAAAIPVEDIAAPLLLIAGADDRLWPSAEFVARIRERLRRAGGSREPVVLTYEAAGHLIGIPNLPSGSTIVGGRLETGGSPEGNASASRDAWPKVLRFLRTAIGR